MAEPRFADDDDLPRTLRRERDARERELSSAEEGYSQSGPQGYASQT